MWIAGIFLYFPYYGIGSDFGFIYFMAILAVSIISPLFFDDLIGLIKRKVKKKAPLRIYLEFRRDNVPKKSHFEFSINKKKILIPYKYENLVKTNEFSNTTPIKEKSYTKYSLKDPGSIILPIDEDLQFEIHSKILNLSLFEQDDLNYFYIEPESLTLRIKADFLR